MLAPRRRAMPPTAGPHRRNYTLLSEVANQGKSPRRPRVAPYDDLGEVQGKGGFFAAPRMTRAWGW